MLQRHVIREPKTTLSDRLQEFKQISPPILATRKEVNYLSFRTE